jgi:hypothetical protein
MAGRCEQDPSYLSARLYNFPICSARSSEKTIDIERDDILTSH